MDDLMSPQLIEVFTGLASGALTVPVVAWIFNKLPQSPKVPRRMTAVTLSFLLGIGGFFGLVFTGVTPMPVGLLGWTGALWPVLTGAYTASQVILSGVRAIWKPGD